MKKCSKCKIEQPLSAFSKNPQTKDGLNCWCRGCRHAAYKVRAAAVSARKKEYYQANREELLRKRREEYQIGIEERRRKQREYKAANPEKVKEWEAREAWR